VQLLDALLDSWDRNNTILTNLLNTVPASALGARPMDGSPAIGELFMHMHYVRLVFLEEDAPEFARSRPAGEWQIEHDQQRLTAMLNESAAAVGNAVRARVEAARAMDTHYDHPILMLQHLIWHEGYHHGQIKLTLKLAGAAIDNKIAGPLTWRVWMNKM
jgi:uncharacterized damage-inducible protein DinB